MMLNSLKRSKRSDKPVCNLCWKNNNNSNNRKGGKIVRMPCLPHCRLKEARVVIERLNLNGFFIEDQSKGLLYNFFYCYRIIK